MKQNLINLEEKMNKYLSDDEMAFEMERFGDVFEFLAYGNISCPPESSYSWIVEIQSPN